MSESDSIRRWYRSRRSVRDSSPRQSTGPSPLAAAANARSIGRAAHLQGGAVPVTVGFSNASGVPTDPDPAAPPRGMAIRFGLPGGAYTDIVANSHNGFVVGTGEDFLAFLKAVTATRPDSPHPSPSEAFLASHPRTLKLAIDNKPLPVSFATLAYYGNTAIAFVTR